jgi:hypothetical protein
LPTFPGGEPYVCRDRNMQSQRGAHIQPGLTARNKYRSPRASTTCCRLPCGVAEFI